MARVTAPQPSAYEKLLSRAYVLMPRTAAEASSLVFHEWAEATTPWQREHCENVHRGRPEKIAECARGGASKR